MADYVIWRSEIAYYYRRIPEEVLPFIAPQINKKGEERQKTHVKISLKTRDKREARKKALDYNDFIEDLWKGLIESGGEDAEGQYKKAVAAAKAFGFNYQPASSVSYKGGAEDHEIISKILTAAKHGNDNQIVESILGGVEKPCIKLSKCIEKYETVTKDRIAGKSADAVRAWLNPRKKAMNNLISVVGDIDLKDFTRSHALQFRAWWMERICEDDLTANSANKDITHSKQILRETAMACELDVDIEALYAKLSLKEDLLPRLPYEPEYVRDVLLRPKTLAALNDEARMIVYAMADTGARNKEIVGLLPDDIVLDTEIPYIDIRPNSVRKLKTPESERRVPLVGSSLEAFKKFPEGFVHYRSINLNNASNTIGKFLRENNLNPTDRHSIYSLRHTFKDRLRAVDATDEMKDTLMGHKSDKPTYGSGYTLEAKRQWLNKIVF